MLDEIVEKTKIRVQEYKNAESLETLKSRVDDLEINYNFPFKKALTCNNISIIAEVKKASPSKGVICEDFNPLEIAFDYQSAGVSAVSVLTEPYFFMGDDEYLKDISENINIPVLRKDFIIDEYMIYQSKLLGADAILLIVAILDIVELKRYLDLAHKLGLSAIVEVHDSFEISKALSVGADIIGVNNRNLKDFRVNIDNSISLRRCVGEDIVFISESGIKTKEDITKLKENNVDAVLIGETLMKSDNKSQLIMEFKDA